MDGRKKALNLDCNCQGELIVPRPRMDAVRGWVVLGICLSQFGLDRGVWESS